MKKKLFYLLALSVSLGLVVSCNKDETKDLETIISENLAGTYSGELNVTVSMEDGEEVADPIDQVVSVEKGEGESITLSIADFSFSGIPVGDVVLENYAVTDNGDGTYSFTGESTLIILNTIIANVSATGTFTVGDTVSLSLSLDISVYEGLVQVTVTYDGTKE